MNRDMESKNYLVHSEDWIDTNIKFGETIKSISIIHLVMGFDSKYNSLPSGEFILNSRIIK